MEDNVRAALDVGLQAIAITDHGPANLFGVGVRDLSVFRTIRDEIEVCQTRFPQIKILLGVEANIIGIDGTLDIPHDALTDFDIILAGLHPLVYPANLVSGLAIAGNLVGKHWQWLRSRLRPFNTKAVNSALTRYPINLLTHPGLHVNIDTKKVAETCARVGTYMEINTSHQHITSDYLLIAFQAGARFMIGSDAHTPLRVGEAGNGLLLAKAAGIPLSAICNASPGQETWSRIEKRYRQ